MSVYRVKDENGRTWKVFKTDKEANDYVRTMSGDLRSILSVEVVEV